MESRLIRTSNLRCSGIQVRRLPLRFWRNQGMMAEFDYDPRRPEVLAWIASLKPEGELVIRLAMRECFPHCRDDHVFRARVELLLSELAADDARLEHFMREAAKAAAIIRASHESEARA
jgi:hypothetical protein